MYILYVRSSQDILYTYLCRTEDLYDIITRTVLLQDKLYRVRNLKHFAHYI
jgi:hypothetical protein